MLGRDLPPITERHQEIADWADRLFDYHDYQYALMLGRVLKQIRQEEAQDE